MSAVALRNAAEEASEDRCHRLITERAIRHEMAAISRNEQNTNPYLWVLERGRSYAGAPPPRDIYRRRGEAPAIATQVLQELPNLRYVEGFVLLPGGSWPMRHAWCVDHTGKVVDACLPDPGKTLYFGVEMPRQTRLAMEDPKQPMLFAGIAEVERIGRSRNVAASITEEARRRSLHVVKEDDGPSLG